MLLRLPARRALPWLALSLAGCDLRNPASPSVAPVPVPAGGGIRQAESALVGSFSAPVGVPEPGERTSYLELAPTGHTLAPNTYTLIRVGGTLKVKGNPYHPRMWGVAASYSAVESAQSTGRGSTNVWLRESGSAIPAGVQKVSYFFRPDGGGRDLVLLVRTGEKAVELWAEREMMPGASRAFGYCMAGFPYCDAEHIVQPDSSVLKKYLWIEDFAIEESHEVTATRLSEPLLVDGPAEVAPGGTASFVARPWEGLRLRDRNGSPSDVRWMWYPNDTTGTPPPNSNPRTICSGQSAGMCTFEPKESGRLHVWSYVEGALVQMDPIVRVRESVLELSCGGTRGARVNLTFTRGDMFDCTVSTTNGVPFTVLGWTFVGGGQTIPSSGQPAHTARRWGGEVVQSGVVSVRALLETRELTATATVTVEPRPWVDRIAEPQIVYHGCAVGEISALTCQLVSPPAFLSDLAHLDPGPKSAPLWVYIANGPNQGFGFFHGAESFVDIREPWIVLNEVLRQPEHDFWKDRPDCDVAELRDKVILHERIHYMGLKEMIDAQPTRGWLENFTPFGAREEVSNAINAKLDEFYTAMYNAGDMSHTNPVFREIQYCYGTVRLPHGRSGKGVRPRR